VALVFLICGLCTSSDAVAEFCHSPARDYRVPLRHFPPVHYIGDEAIQPAFAPLGVTVARYTPISEEFSLLGPGLGPWQIGFGLSFSSAEQHVTQRLDWNITLRLLKITADAETVIGRRTAHIGRLTSVPAHTYLDGDTYLLRLRSKPGNYRVEFIVAGQSGRRLVRYGQYLRVLPFRRNFKLALNSTSFSPGQTVAACLQNFGTELVGYGESYSRFEQFNGSTWQEASFGPQDQPGRAESYLRAGAALPLEPFQLPADATTGLFRWTWTNLAAKVSVRHSEFRIP
jgi:hypothetical protein